jgi:hypothetical protein
MTDSSATPEPILQVVAGLWAAGALKGSLDLKLFDALAAGPRDVAALSQTLGAAPESLRILLDALVALGFVARQARGYALTEVSSTFLVSSQPTYIGDLVTGSANSAGVFDVCKDYRRVVTEGYRMDPWAYSTGSNERVMGLTRNLFTLGYPAAQAIADHLGWMPGAPGGCVIIIEFLVEPGRPESTFSWLFSVMIHGTRSGRSFSAAELCQMLTECGASRTEVGGGLPLGFVVGYRS